MAPEPIIDDQIWWQFEKDMLMGEMRWVHLDEWSNEHAEQFYKLYREEFWNRRLPCRPFEATYRLNPRTGPIDFQFHFTENIYWMQNMKTGERCRIRRIEYVVTAPPSLRTNRS